MGTHEYQAYLGIKPELIAGYDAFDEDEVDPAFSFAGQRLKSMSKAEVQEYIELATWAMDSDDLLKQALRRGIGVHHSGLPTKYRQVVEILFRCGHLRVVLATGGGHQHWSQGTMCSAMLCDCSTTMLCFALYNSAALSVCTKVD